jgi:ABC-type branched-subunit amino acid transport system substrate-binding protein
MTRRPAAALVAAMLLWACTEGTGGPGPPNTPPGADATASARTIVLSVVATVSGPRAGEDRTFLDGIRLGERVVDRSGGVAGRPLDLVVSDDRGREATAAALIRRAVDEGAEAVMVVGPEGSVVRARRDIQAAGTPVVLLGGDLYSERRMFRQTFQTSVPLRWQAAAVARYLVKDRGHRRVSLVYEVLGEQGLGYTRDPASEALGPAMVEEGEHLEIAAGFQPTTSAKEVRQNLTYLRTYDAAVYVGGPGMGVKVVRALRRMDDPAQLATSSQGLLEDMAAGGALPPGMVAPYPYTWAGWAEPIRRVATFRDLARRELGHPPRGFEQEGYDAVRLLADALDRTDGRGGEPLVRALESVDDPIYSSLPIGLGPDDHLFLSDRQLGLFAVAGPDEGIEPWAPEWAPWRPIMRTFTGNGERTTVIDRDKDVFFPGWRPREPAPDFWTSLYGIVTRRGDDPLH